MSVLFRSAAEEVSAEALRRGLEQVGAQDASMLFIHTGMTFGLPNPALPRKELLAQLFEVIESLNVPSVFFPVFTFSFCNGQDFDVQRSRSRMGALNEYVRSQPGTVRSADPQLSVCGRGPRACLLEDVSRESIGAGSFFDRFHRDGSAKFLFFGADPALCFTYVHYVEAMRGVPYRYNRLFTGRIVDGGISREAESLLYVRYRAVTPSERGEYAAELLSRGQMRTAPCGDTVLSAVAEKDAFGTAWDMLDRDIDSLLAEPYPRNSLEDTFEAHDMVAL